MLCSSWPGYVDYRAGVSECVRSATAAPLPRPVLRPLLAFGGRQPELGPVKRDTCTGPCDDATSTARRLVPSRIDRIDGTQVSSYFIQGLYYISSLQAIQGPETHT